jgi:hypothetical protein
MKRSRSRLVLFGLAALLASCSSDSTSPGSGDTIRLTAAQAGLLASRIGQVATATPELGWLTDSVNVVLGAGAEATAVSVETTLTGDRFYAVGLERRFVGSGNSFTTLTFIAFDRPDNPTNFIFVNGYAPSTTTLPPESVSGDFTAAVNQELSGYAFHLSGNQVTTWHSSSGSATLASAGTNGVCAHFQATGVQCTNASLSASFTMEAGADTAGAVITHRTATMSASTVAGVRLTFTP